MPVGAGIAAKIITANETTDIMCYLKDISMSGMAIISDFSLEQDTKIQISFRCDDSIQTVVGNIKQIYEFRSGKRFFYGCEFNEPNEVIGKYIMSKLEKKDNNVAAAAER
nr:PilZ domain-containing protein [Mobilitalea sibirica]